MTIRSVLLDFGGVVYGVDFQKWNHALTAIAGMRGVENLERGVIAELNRSVEMGALSPDAFRRELRDALDTTVDEATLERAWNAILVGLLPNAVEVTAELGRRYRLFLLSNTNALHMQAVEEECADLWSAFEHRYLSYIVGARKPAAAFFERVLRDRGLQVDECLFVDDVAENVDAAARLGMKTVLWPRNAAVEGLLDRVCD